MITFHEHVNYIISIIPYIKGVFRKQGKMKEAIQVIYEPKGSKDYMLLVLKN